MLNHGFRSPTSHINSLFIDKIKKEVGDLILKVMLNHIPNVLMMVFCFTPRHLAPEILGFQLIRFELIGKQVATTTGSPAKIKFPTNPI
jgi:hypothetical protein